MRSDSGEDTMRRLVMLALLLGFAVSAINSPASAQATRTWISGVGDDANPCSRTAPCKTFAGAISKTAAGGQIDCLDPGGFGAVTVTKSITLDCSAGGGGGILSAASSGVIINATSSDRVIVKNVNIDGAGSGLNGIRVLSVGYLHVQDCIISGHNSAAPNGVGIKIATGANMKFAILRTSLTGNGLGSTGAGLQIIPTAGTVTGVIDTTAMDGNVFGIAADGSAGGAGINITVRDSAVSNNSQTGIIAVTGAVGAGIMVSRTTVANNGIGLTSSGAGAIVRIGQSEITGNGTGVTGPVLSYGTNQLNGNGSDGTLTLVPGGPLH
jgi:hypothetical protein